MVFDDNIATFVSVAIQEHSVTFVILRVDFFVGWGNLLPRKLKVENALLF